MIDTNALRKKVLDLAIRGKLVPQNPNDEPASVLLERIREEKQRLIREGKIKKDKVDSIIFRGEDNCHYEKIGDNEPTLLEDLPFEIPANWSWVNISGLFVLQTGASFKKETAMADKSQTRVLRGGNIQRGTYSFFDNDIFIKDELVSPNIYLRKNDLITPAVTSLENIGKIARITEDYDKVTVGGFVFILRGFYNNDILSKYLYYAIQSEYFTEKLKYITKASGSAFFNINKERFLQLILPIPTENEQSKIVSFLDEVFAYIDFIEQNQSDYGTLVESLKKAILQSAIQGKLVEQEETDEPATILLERIREEKRKQLGKKYIESYIYKGDDNRYYEHINGKSSDITEDIPFELPSNWCWARWGDISESIQYGYNAPAKDEGRIKMVRISDIQNGKVIWESVPYCDIDEEDINNYTLKAGDILFARTGGTVGKSYLVTEVPEEAIYAGYLIRTRYSNQLSSQYLKYFMETNLYWLQLTNGTTATAQPNCNGKTLGKMLLPIPPLAEQERIVSKINEIFAQL